jgi:hypothetical protein
METGLLPPPSRKAAVGLADALGMSNRPVTLYVSTNDRDALLRFVFFLTAYVAGEEDVQAIRLVQFGNEEAEKKEEQGSDTPTPSIAGAALRLPDSLFDSLGDEIKEIKRLIDSLSLTDDEEEVVAAHLDTLKRLLLLIENQHKMRKDG